jgi:hypothetical protein
MGLTASQSPSMTSTRHGAGAPASLIRLRELQPLDVFMLGRMQAYASINTMLSNVTRRWGCETSTYHQVCVAGGRLSHELSTRVEHALDGDHEISPPDRQLQPLTATRASGQRS